MSTTLSSSTGFRRQAIGPQGPRDCSSCGKPGPGRVTRSRGIRPLILGSRRGEFTASTWLPSSATIQDLGRDGTLRLAILQTRTRCGFQPSSARARWRGFVTARCRALSVVAAVLVTASLLWLGRSASVALAGGSPCITSGVGIDPAQATSSAGNLLSSESTGQTFVAADSGLRSIAVWRVASEGANLGAIYVTVTETNVSGQPLTDLPLATSSTLSNSSGDGVTPTEFLWQFDPPVALKAGTRYAFFLRTCGTTPYVDFLARGMPDLYVDGCLWATTRGSGCDLPQGVVQFPDADLIFRIEFCGSGAPVRRETWGQLKTVYR